MEVATTRKLTISEGLTWMKTLRERHAELVLLRNENSNSSRRYYGANAEKEVDKTPVYDVKQLDRMITVVAKEIRILDMALKKANAKLSIPDYVQNDDVLGQLE